MNSKMVMYSNLPPIIVIESKNVPRTEWSRKVSPKPDLQYQWSNLIFRCRRTMLEKQLDALYPNGTVGLGRQQRHMNMVLAISQTALAAGRNIPSSALLFDNGATLS